MRDFTEGKTRAKISRTQGNAPKHVTSHPTPHHPSRRIDYQKQLQYEVLECK